MGGRGGGPAHAVNVNVLGQRAFQTQLKATRHVHQWAKLRLLRRSDCRSRGGRDRGRATRSSTRTGGHQLWVHPLFVPGAGRCWGGAATATAWRACRCCARGRRGCGRGRLACATHRLGMLTSYGSSSSLLLVERIRLLLLLVALHQNHGDAVGLRRDVGRDLHIVHVSGRLIVLCILHCESVWTRRLHEICRSGLVGRLPAARRGACGWQKDYAEVRLLVKKEARKKQ